MSASPSQSVLTTSPRQAAPAPARHNHQSVSCPSHRRRLPPLLACMYALSSTLLDGD
ncbi:hypothetical protein M758_3G058200 [Ceratodon purpureus]|nr:hypothetical protein M758_3G058200 [Ceratodon purpureus]